MAAVFSPYSTVGFYKTPLSKGLLGNLFIASCALNVPHLAYLKKYFLCSISDIFDIGEVWRLATCKTVFLDIKDLICGSLLLYYFRIFERRYGSRKFASMFIATGAVTILFEIIIISILRAFGDEMFMSTSSYLSTGPYGLIFPLFVSYFFDIPRVAQTSILGIPITGKTFTYLLGLQMTSSSKASLLSGFSGILAGIFYRYNVLWIQDWVKIPHKLAHLADITFGRLLRSSPPQEGILPMGATLEIQRQQQIEVLEQQMLLNRVRDGHFYQQLPQAPFIRQPQFEDQPELRRRHTAAADFSDGSDNFVDDPDSESGATGNQRESQVQALVEMGFERQRVLQALHTSGNDINIATNILLQDS